MSVYNINGAEINAVYSVQGQALSQCYDISGNELMGGDAPDYDEWSTEYQHTILQARDAWKTKYRADNTVIPLMLHTDQHRYHRYANATFNYLSLAIKWSEVSALVNLGDTCGAVYSVDDLNHMQSCLAPIPTNRKIGVWGNHDCQHRCDDGSGYAYVALNDSEFTTLKTTYFDNSGYGDGTYHVYDNRNNEYVIDKAHGIKYCIFSAWYFGEGGQPYHTPRLTSAAVEAWISMLSSVDDYDIIVLSHIEPYYYTEWYHPAVDGESASIDTGSIDHISKSQPYTKVSQLIADRKAKTNGSIVDYDGVVHNYDFSNCTSDILCWFAGHEHRDNYQWSANNTVPVIILDAEGYDYHPIFMVNVDRTRQLVDVWKIDDSPTFYNFQVPFTKPST